MSGLPDVRPAALFDPDHLVPAPPSLVAPTRPQEGKVGASHPSTAKRAAMGMRLKSGSQRQQIVHAVALRGDAGMTAAQAAEIIHRSRNQTAARILELHEQGWLTFAVDGAGNIEERATDADGNKGRVHVLTPAAWAQLAALT